MNSNEQTVKLFAKWMFEEFDFDSSNEQSSA